jgi:L-seryl-tRNA(Ser) seleniumtransferase
MIKSLKREPIFRALRCDKLRLVALQSTVDMHLRDQSSQVPALQLLQISKDELRARAAVLFERLRGLPLWMSVGRASGKSGGGTLPRALIPSITLDIVPDFGTLENFSDTLRAHAPPIIGYISGGSYKLDLRTVFPFQDDILVDAIRSACSTSANNAEM